MTLIGLLDLAAVFVFALTGGLAASRAQLDVVGFIFIASLTAVGGGTLRDLLLDRTVLWVADPRYLGLTTAAAVLVFFTAHLLESRIRTLTWLDALALAVAVPAGVGIAINGGQPWPIVLVAGVVTGAMGGLMRDVVCNEVPLVLKKGELYATCALAGGMAALLAGQMGLPQELALLVCAAVTFALRAGSLAFGWSLPAYRPRPPRS